MRRYKIQEVCQIMGVDDDVIVEFVRKEWIDPVSVELAEIKNTEFDEEDLARIRLIIELSKRLEVNDEAIPIVLHLVDQIHLLQLKVLSNI